MTFYIPPVLVGVLLTIAVEFVVLAVYGYVKSRKSK